MILNHVSPESKGKYLVVLLPQLSPLGQMKCICLSPLLEILSDPLLLVLALMFMYTDHDIDMEGMLLGQWGSKQTRNLLMES